MDVHRKPLFLCSSVVPLVSPAVLSALADRHVDGGGKPCAAAKQIKGRAALHVRFTGAVSLRRLLLSRAGGTTEPDPLPQHKHHRRACNPSEPGCDPAEAKQREMLCWTGVI